MKKWIILCTLIIIWLVAFYLVNNNIEKSKLNPDNAEIYFYHFSADSYKMYNMLDFYQPNGYSPNSKYILITKNGKIYRYYKEKTSEQEAGEAVLIGEIKKKDFSILKQELIKLIQDEEIDYHNKDISHYVIKIENEKHAVKEENFDKIINKYDIYY